jgi:hypothetical protein
MIGDRNFGAVPVGGWLEQDAEAGLGKQSRGLFLGGYQFVERPGTEATSCRLSLGLIGRFFF